MGVPSYFSYLIKNHKEMLVKLINFKKQINNLYFDSNSIIYDCLRVIAQDYETYKNDKEFETVLIRKVCEALERYILDISPNKRVIIAFDGVAPVAKLEQQRTRRYKSHIEKAIMNSIEDKGKTWDKTAITPGTDFMRNLNISVKNYFNNKEKTLGVEEIICSGSNEKGEGEHKIFKYIRDNEIYHKNTVSVIYGLDADLIMLALNHIRISKQLYLYRETPEFAKSIDSTINPDETYLLDIPLLSQNIILEMNNFKKPSSKQETNKLYDYIFLCFFLGNDFMPHFPSVNIRTNGIDIMLNAYKETISKHNLNLTDGKNIYWKNVKKLIKFLADNEYDNLINEYKIRDRWEKRVYKSDTVDDQKMRYLNIPTKNREVEKFINPYKSFWQKRYYESLFDTEESLVLKKNISINFLEGLEWVMNYYTSDCIDWRWHYNYNYPPLFKDLYKFVPQWHTDMIASNNNKPVTSTVQLAYVFPPESLPLIPDNIGNILLKEKKELYSGNYSLKWAYCKYIWESHIDLPYINLEELENFIEEIKINN